MSRTKKRESRSCTQLSKESDETIQCKKLNLLKFCSLHGLLPKHLIDVLLTCHRPVDALHFTDAGLLEVQDSRLLKSTQNDSGYDLKFHCEIPRQSKIHKIPNCLDNVVKLYVELYDSR